MNFEGSAKLESPEVAAALLAILRDPSDKAAEAIVVKDRGRNSMMRTTCVPTMVTAGHAPNALPQRAKANVNCRILPGNDPRQVLKDLERVAGDAGVKITLAAEPSAVAVTPPLNEAVLGPARKVAAKLWPGVPIIPTMTTGATDGRYTTAAGIPTYGLSGLFGDPDGGGTHGLNERIRVKSLYDGRTFLYEVVRIYADQK